MTTAIRSITRIQDADDFGSTPGAGSDGYALTWDNNSSQFALASSGNFSADGSTPMTDTLTLEGIDDGESALVLQIPVSSADGADFNFNIGSTLFSPTYDTTFNWGFNNDTGGPAVATKHAWYLQLEYDYYTGQHYAEYHLNLFGANGSFNFRPFEYKYRIDGSGGSLVYKASSYQILSLDESPHTVISVTAAATSLLSSYYIKSQFRVDIPDNATTGFYLVSDNGAVPILAVDTNENDLRFRSRVLSFANTAGTVDFSRLSDGKFAMNGETYNGAALNILAPTNGSGIYLRTAATDPKPHIIMASNAGTVEFAVSNGGSILTNQTTANTATPSGATAYQLPIYGIAGVLLGYIPVYGSAWS